MLKDLPSDAQCKAPLEVADLGAAAGQNAVNRRFPGIVR
jgi:hypothetical protein